MNIKHFWESCSVNFPKVSVSKLKTFTKPGWCRLTKYQLLLKDLAAASPSGSTKYTLELSLESVLSVIKADM